VAVKGLGLLLCDNPAEAAVQAKEITELNKTRKEEDNISVLMLRTA
jgi:hypothetical protein